MADISDYRSLVQQWQPESGFSRIEVVDMHTAGEPLRIILGGWPTPQGSSILQRRNWSQSNCQALRQAMMREPRGHADMYGCLIVPAESPDGDFGVLFMHNEGYSSMCGHGVIALATAAVQFLWVQVTEPITIVKIDTPAGRVTAEVDSSGGQVHSVFFENVPSFAAAIGRTANVPGLGDIEFDLGFGGAFYVFVDAEKLELACTIAESSRLIELGTRITQAAKELDLVRHPVSQELSFLYGTILVGPGRNGAHSRHVCIFADGQLDRSPTGTGVSARAAILHAKNQLAPGAPIEIDSILGTRFSVEVVRNVEFAGWRAVIPRVGGRAFVTGRHEFLIDPRDPLAQGFLLRSPRNHWSLSPSARGTPE